MTSVLRIITGCLVAFMGFSSVAVHAETLTILGSDNLIPKSWQEGEQPRGYAVDAAREALSRAGFDVEVKLSPWARAVEEARVGKGVINHFSKTPERQKSFVYSDPLVYDRIVVVVKRGGEFPFNSVKDLAGKTVGVLRGVAYGGEWSAVLGTFTREEDKNAEARVGKLFRGRIDAAVISSGAAGLKVAAERAGLDPAAFTILPVPILLDPNYLGMAKGPGVEEKMARINAAIAEMHADGTIARIMSQYGDQ